MNTYIRPKLELLSNEFIEKIILETFELLEKVGVEVENKEGAEILLSNGCKMKGKRITIDRDIVKKCISSAPKSIKVHNRKGELKMNLEGDNVYFNPGSAALFILDWSKKSIRKPLKNDVINLTRLVDALPNLSAQSTALVPSDVPANIADRYRLYLVLQHSTKPVITGTFVIGSFSIMKDMLVAVRGSEEALKEKPLAIFDCCPSPPLKWSNLTCNDLIACAKFGIPAELVSMPLSGGTAPVTLAGSLVQHTAENLSGITIHQLASPGSPIIYGGSPSIMDMRKGTTPMGAIETMMIDSAYNQIGKHFGLPTHSYMCLSDTKTLDYQAGLESGIGAIMGVLSGINVISGAGMLDFENCQSLEKLILDNEICGMAHRLADGIKQRSDMLAEDLFKLGDTEYNFLASSYTLKWFKSEHYHPSEVIDRGTYDEWTKRGGKSAGDRANELVEKILAKHNPEPLPNEVVKELRRLIGE